MRRRAVWYEKLRQLVLSLFALLMIANVLCAAGRFVLSEPWCLRDESASAIRWFAELRQDLFGSHLGQQQPQRGVE